MVDTYTTPCQYAHCKYTCPLSICPPLVNMPASCQHLCQYAHPLLTPSLLLTCLPTIDTPALLLISLSPVDMPAPCQYTHLLSICLPPVDTHVDMPTLLLIHPLPVDMPTHC